MKIVDSSQILLWTAAVLIALPSPVAAQQEQRRPSSRIIAFGDEPKKGAPAPEPAPPPPAADTVTKPDPKVVLGAVIPPPPQVRLAAAAVGRPYDGIRTTPPAFVARAAAATRLSVNSPFGVRSDPLTGLARMHTGVDLRATYGESVGVSMSGKVWFAGQRTGYGNVVVVDHGTGIATLYAHLSQIAVATGQSVEAGQLIGYVGSTGRSTGPHLHYEVRANGRPVDPGASIAVEGDKLVVNGQSLGLASTSGPVALPRPPGGTSIAVDWDAETVAAPAGGQALSIDWE